MATPLSPQLSLPKSIYLCIWDKADYWAGGEARYFLFRQKVTKNHSQSNALCSLIKVTGLLVRRFAMLGGRLLQGPSLAPVACAGKVWLT